VAGVYSQGRWGNARRRLTAVVQVYSNGAVEVEFVKQPYGFEYRANRIAAAYWREHDPSVIAHQRGIFKYVLDRVPSPVAAGGSAEAYFDNHYPDKFKSGPEYTWFQAGMCLKVFDESPAPSFAQALKETKP